VTYEIEPEELKENMGFPSSNRIIAKVTYALNFDGEKSCPRCGQEVTFCRPVFLTADIEMVDDSGEGTPSTEISEQLYQEIIGLAEEKLENDEVLNSVVCLCPSLIEQDKANQVFDYENQLKLIFPDSSD
jgi:hypothetical protein